MKVCDLNSGVGQLSQAFSQLKTRWLEARKEWHDETSRQFEEKYLREIPQEFQQLFGAISQLSEVLEKAEKECGDQEDEI